MSYNYFNDINDTKIYYLLVILNYYVVIVMITEFITNYTISPENLKKNLTVFTRILETVVKIHTNGILIVCKNKFSFPIEEGGGEIFV